MGSAPRSSHVAHVLARRDAGGEMTLVTFDVPAALRESYTHPGQYALFTFGEDEGYFVLASQVGRAPWEILLRARGGVADSLLAAPIGAPVSVSRAIGEGFPVERARGEDAVVVVTAAAIGAARATVSRRIDDGDATRTRLVVGARDERTLPLANELADMRRAGVPVRIVLSTADVPTYDRGYVQHALAREPFGDAWVFIAGAPEMVDGVRAVATARGVAPERIISNN